MNMQMNHSGKIAGDVPGPMLGGQSQRNADLSANQLQNSGVHFSALGADPELGKSRRLMLQKIYELFSRRRQPSPDTPNRKLFDIAKRIEEGLFRSATSKEEYLNPATLERRLQYLVRRLSMGNVNQQLSHGSSSVPVGAMIPTPGFQQTETNSMGTSLEGSMVSGANAITSSTIDSRGFLSNRIGPSGSTHVAGGHRQSSPSLSANIRGSNAISSAEMPRMTYQMIPTPGIRNSTNDPDDISVNETTQNLDSLSNSNACPASESTSALQPLPQSRHNLHPNNMTSQSNVGVRPLLQHKSLGGPFNVNVGTTRNRMRMVNGIGTTEMHLPIASHENSTRQLQQPEMRGDIQVISADDSSGPGNVYTTSSSVPTLEIPCSNALSMPVRATSSFENLQSQQHSQFPRGQGFHQIQLRKQLQSHMTERHSVGQQQSTNSVSEVKPDFGMENVDAVLQSQMSQSFQFSDAAAQSNILDPCSDLQVEASEHMQLHLHPQNILVNPRSDYAASNDSGRQQFALENHQSGLSQSVIASETVMPESHAHDAAKRNQLSSAESVNCKSDMPRSADLLRANDAVCPPKSIVSDHQQFRNQQKWLLFLRHARRCPAPEGKCREKHCITVQKLLKHVEQCNALKCDFPRCSATRLLVNHNRLCRDSNCPVCVPVKIFLQARARSESNVGLQHPVSESFKKDLERSVAKIESVDMQENFEPSNKRQRTDQACQPPVSMTKSPGTLPSDDSVLKNEQIAEMQYETCTPLNSKLAEPKVEIPDIVGQLGPKNAKLGTSEAKGFNGPLNDPEHILDNPSYMGEQKLIKAENHLDQDKLETCQVPPENTLKGGKTKVKGVSMIELFTPEQVRQHIQGLRQWIGQSKAKAERNQAMGHSMNENSCQLCALEKLSFEPPPIYCSSCGIRIKRNAMYHAAGAGEARHCFCTSCYNASRGDTIVLDGITIPKARMEKKKNDEETEESWVQCDKCEAWQHQICALFNGRRNDGGQAEYTCPNCYMMEVDQGERMPLPQSAILGAKDLPRTSLSDHLEQRLYAKLKQERHDRARFQGKDYDEVPGAEELVVRVVSSADKKLDVKPRFLEIFREENYPTDFPYKSKVVLLFQRIEGVEVFLFGMYVQEFGSESLQPNHRRVYLSYLDSVKYFRPDIKAVTGEALRTFVYHEILIGYLEYCKKRGFTSCYIWACPPLKGEDYIIYCHPEIQKTPKSDKLREWYLVMLRKAMKENIVVRLTNLYEHFFVSPGECKARVTAARLPYFDGDYWPGAAEDFIYQLQQEEDGKKPQKGCIKKSISKRALKASGQTDLSGNASKDLLLMRKLGETISPMKEDFIMVHLQHACSHCCILMVSGNRWICRQCKNFQVCDKCHEADLALEDRERHPVNQRDVHTLYPEAIVGIPDDTRDTEFIDSEIFDTRQAFLTLCQGNHYQYDTLRRAKHSSMMVLYHLHNPSAPAFVTQCATCHLDIEGGHGWHCETCPDYGVCNACYQKDGGRHPHKLISHQSNDQLACNKEARQSRVLQQLRKMLDLLVHASKCPASSCQYPNCRKVKGLFRHGMSCLVRASGGCQLCKKMWYLLQLHSRACRESVCNVPRCRDMREHVRRLQQQSDSRRRAAVNEMMRQRAAEAAGCSS